MSHFLTEKNLDTMTAVCAVDGPVSIRRKGPRVQCAVRIAERKAAYASRHPEKIRANRALRSEHRLTAYDPATDTATCAVCGLSATVPYGTGYACENTPAVKKRRVQQDAPQPLCPVHTVSRAVVVKHPDGTTTRVAKRTVPLRADGTCPECEAEAAPADWSSVSRTSGAIPDGVTAYRSTRVTGAKMGQLAELAALAGPPHDGAYGRGYDVITTRREDPVTGELVPVAHEDAAMPAHESAVFGWKTVSTDKSHWRERDAVTDWWAKNGHLVEGAQP